MNSLNCAHQYHHKKAKEYAISSITERLRGQRIKALKNFHKQVVGQVF